MQAALLLFMFESLATGNADTVDFVQTKLNAKAASVFLSFDEYVKNFSRTYQADTDEYAMRRSLFQRRLEAVNAHNSQPNRLWTAGLNHLTDYSDAEYQVLMGYRGLGRRSHAGTGLMQVETDSHEKMVKEDYDEEDEVTDDDTDYDYDDTEDEDEVRLVQEVNEEDVNDDTATDDEADDESDDYYASGPDYYSDDYYYSTNMHASLGQADDESYDYYYSTDMHASDGQADYYSNNMHHSSSRRVAPSDAPEADWTHLASLQNAVDQGMCGSCWAVSTKHLLESRYEVNHGDTRTVSLQEILECTPNEEHCGGDGGCEGATAELGLMYVRDHGVAKEEDLEYTASSNNGCTAEKKKDSNLFHGRDETVLVNGYTDFQTLPSNKAQPLLDALLEGPVGVSVAAGSWSMYQSGVFDGCQDWVINHAVIAVGFGQEDGTNYWKIKNSWGPDWGEKSYMKLLRGASAEEDDKNCGVDHQPEEGIACLPYPDQVTTCGMCGILYDTTTVTYAGKGGGAGEGGGGGGGGRRPQEGDDYHPL